MTTTPSSPPILSEIEETIDFLQDASEHLSGGTPIDLAWLERRVSFLCNQAEALSPEERDPARVALETLTGVLDKLETELQKRIQTLPASSDSIPNSARQTEIYRKNG